MPRSRKGRTPYSLALDAYEREMLQHTIKEVGNAKAAAAALGITRAYLYRRLDQLRLLNDTRRPRAAVATPPATTSPPAAAPPKASDDN